MPNVKTETIYERLGRKSWDISGSFSNNYLIINWTNQRIGSSLPGWRNALKQSRDATTAMSGTKSFVEFKPGHAEWQGYVKGFPAQRRLYGQSGMLDMFNPTVHAPTYANAAKAESIASSQFIKEVGNAYKAMEGLETLAELPKTARSIMQRTGSMISLLTNWKRTLSSGLDAARRGNRGAAARRATAAVSNAYLEWRFAYEPLVKDIRGLAEKLADDTVIIPFKAFGKASGMYLPPTEAGGGMSGLSWKSITTYTEESTVYYKGAIKVEKVGASGYFGQLGMSPSNFVPTLYNLLPWTYMIDYFTNVGDMVSGLSMPYPQIAWVNRTVRSTVKVVNMAGVSPQMDPNFVADPGYPIVVPSTISCKRTDISRSSSRPNMTPSFHWKVPDFATESGRRKWTNIAAVLAARTFGDSKISLHNNG